MQLTDRDRKVCIFLCRYWAADADQIRREFFPSMPTAYRRLKALKLAGYLESEQIFAGQPGHYWVTRTGALYADVGLPAPREIKTKLLEHASQVVDLSFRIRKGHLPPEEGGFPQGRCEDWISERELRRDKMLVRRDGETGRLREGRSGRTPDGIAVLDTGEQVAMELELSLKPKGEYERILNYYRRERDAGRLDGARLFFPSVPTMRRVEGLARRRGVGSFVEFYPYKPIMTERTTVPMAGPAPSREGSPSSRSPHDPG